MAFVRCLIFGGAIALVASINGVGKNLQARLADTNRRVESIPSRYSAEPLPEPLPLSVSRKLNDLEKAYLDSYSILKLDNFCSEFFGGSQAIEVLNRLTQQIRPAYLDRRVGLRMTGETINVLNIRTGFKYRVFDKAEVNLDGPSIGHPVCRIVPMLPALVLFLRVPERHA